MTTAPAVFELSFAISSRRVPSTVLFVGVSPLFSALASDFILVEVLLLDNSSFGPGGINNKTTTIVVTRINTATAIAGTGIRNSGANQPGLASVDTGDRTSSRACRWRRRL
jgi:hypothetical protein